MPFLYLTKKLSLICGKSGHIRYAKSAGWQLSERVISLTISFLVTAFIIRSFGPSNFGLISFAVSFISIFSFLTSPGIDMGLYRDVIKNSNEKHKLIETAFFLKLAGGIIAALLTITIALAIGINGLPLALIIILSSIFITTPFQVVLYDFRAQANTKSISLIALAINCILNILKVLALIYGLNVMYIVAILALEPLLGAVAYITLYSRIRAIKLFSWRPQIQYIPILLHGALPFIILAAFTALYHRIDQVLISTIMDSASVGLYDAAVKIAEVWQLIPAIIVSSLFPAIVNARTTSAYMYFSRLKKLLILILCVTVVLAVAVTFIAPFVIKILYGSAYIESIGVLHIYLWSSIGVSAGIVIMHFLIAENMRRVIALSAIIPATINIILNLILIPRFGIEGAALATLISYSTIPFSPFLFKQVRTRISELNNESKLTV